jgi:hypothetical protein
MNSHPGRTLASVSIPLLSLALLCAATVTSCAVASEPLVARGLLTGEPCGPPCWQGLVPGKSTEAEISEFLTTSGYTGPGVERSGYAGPVVIQWHPRWPHRGQNTFYLQDGVLQIIRMHVDCRVTLGEVVNRYGPPDKLATGRRVLPFHRSLGMMLELPDVVELTPETRIVAVKYYQPASLHDVLAVNAWGQGKVLTQRQRDQLREWLRGWHDWQGYGSAASQPPMLPPGPPGTP